MTDFEDFEVASSKVPFTLASALTIKPKTRFTRITGTISIQTIVPPVDFYHELVFLMVSASIGGFLISGGNIQFPSSSIGLGGDEFAIIILFYDPRFKKYYTTSILTLL